MSIIGAASAAAVLSSGTQYGWARGLGIGGVLFAILGASGSWAHRTTPGMRSWVDENRTFPTDVPRRIEDEARAAERAPEWQRKERRTVAVMGWYAWGRTEHYARFRRVYLAVGCSSVVASGIFVLVSMQR